MAPFEVKGATVVWNRKLVRDCTLYTSTTYPNRRLGRQRRRIVDAFCVAKIARIARVVQKHDVTKASKFFIRNL